MSVKETFGEQQKNFQIDKTEKKNCIENFKFWILIMFTLNKGRSKDEFLELVDTYFPLPN